MPTLEEYAATVPVKGVCVFCKQRVPAELLPEINAGLLAGIPRPSVVAWLKAEHGIDVDSTMVGNHLRGLKSNPERHS